MIWKKIVDLVKDHEWFKDFFSIAHTKKSIIELIVCSAAINILSLALPLTLMQVYDRIIGYKSYATLTWLTAGCFTALLLETFLRMIRGYISKWIAARYEFIKGNHVINSIINADVNDYEKKGFGKNLQQMQSVNVLKRFFSGQVFQILLDFPFALLYLAVIFILGKVLVLIPLLMITIFYLFVFIIKKKFEHIKDREIKIDEKRMEFLINTLGRISMIKGISAEEQILRKHENIQKDKVSNQLILRTFNLLPSIIGFMLSQLTIFGIICTGGIIIINGSLTLGIVTACSIMGSRALQPIQSIADLWINLTEVNLARQRIESIDKLEKHYTNGSTVKTIIYEGSVELQDVCFRYGPDKPYIFKSLNFTVLPNQFISFKSPAGSGVSTLLNLIFGMVRPETGRILIDNHDLADCNLKDLHGLIEYVPPQGRLFKGSIIDNITMFNPSKYIAALDAASLMDLDDDISQLPRGYETEIDYHHNIILPSGLIQRISFARALVLKPRILLIDNCDQAMDDRSFQVFGWVLSKLKGRVSILIDSSHKNIVELSDKIYTIENKQLITASRD